MVLDNDHAQEVKTMRPVLSLDNTVPLQKYGHLIVEIWVPYFIVIVVGLVCLLSL